jgi:hypothetical protein
MAGSGRSGSRCSRREGVRVLLSSTHSPSGRSGAAVSSRLATKRPPSRRPNGTPSTKPIMTPSDVMPHHPSRTHQGLGQRRSARPA